MHAFEERRNGGVLVITGRIHDGVRVFEVEDNGKGITDEIMERIQTGSGGSVGINNVTKRIKILYGESYGVDFQTEQGQGTKVTIRIQRIKTKIML